MSHPTNTPIIQAWSRTVGPSQAWVVDYAITALAFGICIVYACFVGDTFTSLLKGTRNAHRTDSDISRTTQNVQLYPTHPNPRPITHPTTRRVGAGLPPMLSSREASILGVTALVLFPLTLLKDLSALQYSSYVGIAAVLYTVVFIARRYYDGSYAPGGDLFKAIPAAVRPKPAAFGNWQVCGPGLLYVVCQYWYNDTCSAAHAHPPPVHTTHNTNHS